MEKITAVVVTYNRFDLLKQAIKSLRSQTRPLDSIIVINNGSTDGTHDWLDQQKDLDVIHQENVGGSGGFYRGIQYAHEKGFDWIWCMDDDVFPKNDCLENLLEYSHDKNIGMLCPLRIQDNKPFLTEIKCFNLSNPFRSLHCSKVNYDDIEQNQTVSIEGIAFEGPLIRNDVVSTIGLPNKDLFILYDDSDYSYRCKLAGYEIKIVVKAILNKTHFHIGESREVIIQKNKWKTLYHIRNTAYFNMKYGKNVFVRRFRSFMMLIKFESYVLKNIPFNSKYRLSDFFYFYIAYRFGIKAELGRLDL